jgi:hypothetical protein
MTDETLHVTGGAGGVTASYEDMLTYADRLSSISGDVVDHVGPVQVLPVNGNVLASTPLSPGTAARVGTQAIAAADGPHGMLVSAARLKATSVSLQTAVTAYRAVDEAQAQLADGLENIKAPFYLASVAGEPALELFNALMSGDPLAIQLAIARIPGMAGENLNKLLYENPWLVDALLRDVSGLMTAAGFVMPPWMTAALNAWTLSAEGSPFPPWGLEQTTTDLIAFGEAFGLFEAGTGSATAVTENPYEPDPNKIPMPDSVEGLFNGIGSLGRHDGRVRVFQVTGPDGVRRWVVQIPGTQEWSPTAGENPVDMTNNLRLMAGQQTAQNEAIRQAMEAAGIPPGEPVMLAGHSQGGITAASLASDPATQARFNITHVVTGGSPISNFSIPPHVTVLSVEHNQDMVPRLDANESPDRHNWVTVHRDPTGVVNNKGEQVDDPGETHDSGVYAQTGGLIDTSEDPSLVAVRNGFAPFLSGDPSTVKVQEFDMKRNVG